MWSTWGSAIAEELGKAGISVLHDRTLYDYPEYAGAYDRALPAIEAALKQYPSIHFVLDVHRDAIEDSAGNQIKVVSDIDGVGTAAQLSLVVGSDGGGLSHPDWIENLRLAAAVQEQVLTDYPTLMRPLLLRNSRYNQHATHGSLLLEVGTPATPRKRRSCPPACLPGSWCRYWRNGANRCTTDHAPGRWPGARCVDRIAFCSILLRQAGHQPLFLPLPPLEADGEQQPPETFVTGHGDPDTGKAPAQHIA